MNVEWISIADRAPDEAPDEWFLDELRSPSSRARGDYATTLERWRAVLGEEAVLTFWFEDVCRDPLGVLALARLDAHRCSARIRVHVKPAAASERIGIGLPVIVLERR